MRNFVFNPVCTPKNNYQAVESIINEFSKTPFGTFLKNELVSKRPDVNIKETETDFQVVLAAPGLEKTDFNIAMEKDILTISVKKEVENEEQTEKFTHKEFSYTAFSRTFHLPENINKEEIAATYEQGLLTVKLPKLVAEEIAKAKKNINVL